MAIEESWEKGIASWMKTKDSRLSIRILTRDYAFRGYEKLLLTEPLRIIKTASLLICNSESLMHVHPSKDKDYLPEEDMALKWVWSKGIKEKKKTYKASIESFGAVTYI